MSQKSDTNIANSSLLFNCKEGQDRAICPKTTSLLAWLWMNHIISSNQRRTSFQQWSQKWRSVMTIQRGKNEFEIDLAAWIWKSVVGDLYFALSKIRCTLLFHPTRSPKWFYRSCKSLMLISCFWKILGYTNVSSKLLRITLNKQRWNT